MAQNILLNNKPVATGYVETNFELFFQRFNESLVMSDSYVTKRQSTKLLGEILLDRAYYRVMIAYVARWDNLKLCMTLLKDDQKMIQYEGFHVFKVQSCVLRADQADRSRYSSRTRTSPSKYNAF